MNETNQLAVPSLPLSSAEQETASLPNLERIIRGLLYLYVFALPFERLLFIERNGFIILLALLTLWCLVNRRHFFMRTPVDLPLIALVGWVGISVPFATFPDHSLQEWGKLLQQALVFYVAVYFFRNEKDRASLSALLIGTLALVSLYGIWQFDLRPWLGSGVQGGREYLFIKSFLSAEIWLTTYLLTVIPLSAAAAFFAPLRWQRVSAGLVTGLAIACEILTFSRGGLLGLLVEAVGFAVLLRSKIVTMLTVGFVGACIVGASALVIMDRQMGLSFVPQQNKLTSYNLEARFKVWNLGLEKLQEHPLAGIGYGKSAFYWATRTEPARLAADREAVPMALGLHNTFMDLTVGAGIPAGVAYLWLMWLLAKTGWRRFLEKPCGLHSVWPLSLFVMIAGVFVRNCFDHMWIGTLALLFWVVVALSLQPMIRPEQAQSS